MGLSKAREAQRARRAREQAGGTSSSILPRSPQRSAVDRRRKVISVLDVRIVNSVLHCTVKWANNSTSEESLLSLLRPNARDAVNAFQESSALTLFPSAGPSTAAQAELKRAEEARARLEAELREVQAQNAALISQNQIIKETSQTDAK